MSDKLQVKATQNSSGAITASGVLQRKCACGSHTIAGGACESCGKEKTSGKLQRVATNSEPVNEAPPIVHDVLRSPGQPLDVNARSFFEPRFVHDFSHVRVHTDARAAESARAVSAFAYTVGPDIVFAKSQYAPDTGAGRHLLAHELAHVIQQNSTAASFSSQGLLVADLKASGLPLEHQADALAETVMHPPSSVPISVQQGTGASRLQRKVDDNERPKENYSEGSWEDLQRDVHDWLNTWMTEQINTVVSLRADITDSKEEDGAFQIPELLKELMGLVPKYGSYAGILAYLFESLFNWMNGLANTPVSVEDFFDNAMESQNTFLRELRGHKLAIFDAIREQSSLETEENRETHLTKVRLDVFESLNSLPSAEQIRKILLTRWVSSAQDVSWWEEDFGKGSTAGYIYMRVIREAQPFGKPAWNIIKGPFIDDVERPQGTNKAVQHMFKKASIHQLPFEIQLQVESTQPLTDGWTMVKALKARNPKPELDLSPKWTATFGSKLLLGDWLQNAPKPTVNDLVVDD